MPLPLVGGSLYSTGREMARFARMMLHEGRFAEAVVLPKPAWKEFLKRPFAEGKYGHGWVLEFGKKDEVVAVGHNGSLSGYRSIIRIDLKRRSYLVLHWTIVSPAAKDNPAAAEKLSPLVRRVLASSLR
jgi:CubicO group peptidase (beta-lactamase class C family)